MFTYLYLLIDFFVILIPLFFTFHKRLNFFRNYPPFFISTFVVGAVFVVWDVYFTNLGYWGFNPNYLTGISDGYKSILLSRHDIPILLLPYTQESWNEADEIILKILTAVKLSKFKNGLQIFS